LILISSNAFSAPTINWLYFVPNSGTLAVGQSVDVYIFWGGTGDAYFTGASINGKTNLTSDVSEPGRVILTYTVASGDTYRTVNNIPTNIKLCYNSNMLDDCSTTYTTYHTPSPYEAFAGTPGVVDSTAPTPISISITDNSGYTNNSTPTLTLSASDNVGVTGMAFSCNSSGPWTDWTGYSTSYSSFNIASGLNGCGTGNGSKTIYVKFRDAQGNESSIISDTTYYDTVAPSLSSVTLSNNAIKAGRTATVTFTFSDASGVLNSDTFTLADDVTYDTVSSTISGLSGGSGLTRTATLTANGVHDLSNIITVGTNWTDMAGNVASAGGVSPNYTITPPFVQSVAYNANEGNQTLSITFDDTINASNVDLSKIYIRENGQFSGGVQLTGATVTSGDGSTITIQTTEAQRVAIKHLLSKELDLDAVAVRNTSSINYPNEADNNNVISYTEDTTPPIISSLEVNIDWIGKKDVGEDKFITTIVFNEDMNTSIFPVIEFLPEAYSTLDCAGYWDNLKTFKYSCDVSDENIKIEDIDVRVTNARDIITNNQMIPHISTDVFNIDTVNPTLISLTLNNSNLKIGDTPTLTIVFSEYVNGFTLGNLTPENGSLSDLSTENNITWTATFTPDSSTEDNENKITIDLTDIKDLAENSAQGSVDSNNYAIDTKRPTLEITMSSNKLKIGDTSLVTFTFHEEVTGFASSGITIENGSLSTLSTENNIIFTSTFTPTSNIEDTTNVIEVDMSTISDLIGNSGSGTVSSSNYQIDTIKPTLTLSSSQTSPTNATTINMTATFSEEIDSSTFTISDITVTNGTVDSDSLVDVNGQIYTFNITPSEDGAVIVNIDANQVTDLFGNENIASNEFSIEYDSITPEMLNVTTDKADGYYKAGEVIDISIIFSKTVVVNGTPRLYLNSGDVFANYNSGSDSNTLVFRYTVQPGDNSTDLDYDTINSLNLFDSSTIKDIAGNDANITLFVPGQEGSLGYNKDIVIDTVKPTLLSIILEDYAFKIGDTSLVTFTFSEKVNNFNLTDVIVGNGQLSDLNTSDDITFTATFTPAEDVEHGTNIIRVDLSLVNDLASNAGEGNIDSDNYTIDTVRPVVSNITSTNANTFYNLDANIDIQIVFSETVIVDGTPILHLNSADNAFATYLSGSNSDTLVFRYTVQEDDDSLDLDYVTINSLDLNGSTIKDVSGNDANINLFVPGQAGSLGANKNIIVDALKPTLDDIVLTTEWIGEKDVGSNKFLITIVFSEAMNTGINPGIVFIPSVSSTLACNGIWSDSDTYSYSCDVTDAEVEQEDISVRITNARDIHTNKMDAFVDVNAFNIDTIKPTITISDNASASWTTVDTITSNPTDGIEIDNTRWIISDNNTCNSTKDSLLDDGVLGINLDANSQDIYYNKYICFRTMDLAGNKAYVSSNIIDHLDTQVPSVDVGADIDANAIFLKEPTTSDTTSGIASYLWSFETDVEDGVVTFSAPTSKNTNISANIDGIYTISLTVKDHVDYNATDSFTLVWDTTAPDFNMGGSDSNVYTNDTATFTINVIEEGSGIESYLWTFTTDVSGGVITFGSDDNYSTTISANENGLYEISFTVTDNAGNFTTKDFNFIWDQESPSIVFDEDIYYEDEVMTEFDEFTITETISGIASYLWEFETNGDGVISFDTNSAILNPDIFANQDGNYTITLTVTDKAGNQDSDSFILIWDTTLPEFEFTQEVYYTNTTFNTDSIYQLTEEDLSGIASYLWEDITVGGIGTITFSSSLAQFPTIDADQDGTYNIRLTLTDNVGNDYNSNFNLVWDTVKPTLQKIIVPSRFEVNFEFDENIIINPSAGSSEILVNGLEPFSETITNNILKLIFEDNLVTDIVSYSILEDYIMDLSSNGILAIADNLSFVQDYAAPYSYVDSSLNDANQLTIWLTEALYDDQDTLLADDTNLSDYYLLSQDINQDTFNATYFSNGTYKITFEIEGATEGSRITLLTEDDYRLYDSNQNKYAPMSLILEDEKWIFKRMVDENTTSFTFNLNDSSYKYIIPSNSITNTTLATTDLSSVLSDENTFKIPEAAQDLYFERQTPETSYSATIYAGTTISGNNWDGIFVIPTITSNFSITNGTADVTITVGSNLGLTFDKAVKLVIGDMAGKRAAWNDGTTTNIISECTAAQKLDPDTLPSAGDCYTTEGSDLVIWTKHMTDFAAFTLQTSSSGSSSPGTSSSPGGTSGTTNIVPGSSNDVDDSGSQVDDTSYDPTVPQPIQDPITPVDPTVTPPTEEVVPYDFDLTTDSKKGISPWVLILIVLVVLGIITYFVIKSKKSNRGLRR